MYGHTHKPVIDVDKDITAINPGSLSFPRQEGRKPSYIIMDLDRDGQVHYHLNFCKKLERKFKNPLTYVCGCYIITSASRLRVSRNRGVAQLG